MRIKSLLTRLHHDDAGAMSVEKILILAIVSVPILIALWLFKKWISTEFTNQQTTLQNDVSGNGG